jgi:hypothetical protein
MQNKIGIVYKWENIDNQKWYIGSHYGKLDDGYIGSGKVFQNAYAKNQNKMIRSILYTGQDFRQAEEFFLLYLDAARDRQSYNMKNTALGGGPTVENMSIETRQRISDALRNRVRKPFSEETKNKISATLTGRKVPKELCEKRKLNSLGDKNPFYGKVHTDETKEKIRTANKGKCHSGFEFMKALHKKAQKKVYSGLCNLTFDSHNDCAKYFNVNPSSISNMIANRIKNRFLLTIEMPNPCGVHTFSGDESLYLKTFCAKFPDSPYCIIPTPNDSTN